MKSEAQLVGISVGPGDPELITVKGLAALRACDVLIAPQAKASASSVARSIIDDYGIPAERFRNVLFEMDRDRKALRVRYREVAAMIEKEIGAGKTVGFLTLGDALTFSTWIYTLRAVRERCPNLRVETIPGVTSYAALAAATDWPLGEQKQGLLVSPCPDDMATLRAAIEAHDRIVLMKIGRRLPQVLALLRDLGIGEGCVFGKKVGMDGEEVFADLADLPGRDGLGYFSTLLICCDKGG